MNYIFEYSSFFVDFLLFSGYLYDFFEFFELINLVEIIFTFKIC